MVFEIPDIVQVSSLDIRMHSKTQNTISIIESDSLIKSQEFKISTGSLVLVNASLISEQFTFKLSRSVIEILVISGDHLSRS